MPTARVAPVAALRDPRLTLSIPYPIRVLVSVLIWRNLRYVISGLTSGAVKS